MVRAGLCGYLAYARGVAFCRCHACGVTSLSGGAATLDWRRAAGALARAGTRRAATGVSLARHTKPQVGHPADQRIDLIFEAG